MGRSAALVGVFALVLFACTSEAVPEDASTSSTQPAIASALGAASASDGVTTATADPLTTNEPSTTETTGLATTSSTTTTFSTTVTISSPTPTTTPTTTLPPTTTTASPTTTTASPTTHYVSIGDDFFAPAPVTISVGDTIRWTNGGGDIHTTTSGQVGNPDGLWNSGVLTTGAFYSQTFPVAGTFQYFCTIHGGKMQATVIVQG